MNKTVHITFGDSAHGVLKHFLSQKNIINDANSESIIVNIREDFSLGPLEDLSREVAINNRIEWFDSSLLSLCYSDLEEIEKCSVKITDSYKLLSKIHETDRLIIWNGENASDQIALRYLSDRFKSNSIYELNISLSLLEDNKYDYYPISLAECDHKMLEKIFGKESLMSVERKSSLINEWNELKKNDGLLRIYNSGLIENVSEDYYDKLILSNCTFNYKRASTIIGITMGQAHQMICDTYIHCRLINLINSGKIIFKGDKKDITSLEIKKSENLVDFLAEVFGVNNNQSQDGRYNYVIENLDHKLIVETKMIELWPSEELINKMVISYNDKNVFSLTIRREGEITVFINNIVVSSARLEKIKRDIEIDGEQKDIIEESIFISREDNLSETIIIKLSPYFTVGII